VAGGVGRQPRAARLHLRAAIVELAALVARRTHARLPLRATRRREWPHSVERNADADPFALAFTNAFALVAGRARNFFNVSIRRSVIIATDSNSNAEPDERAGRDADADAFVFARRIAAYCDDARRLKRASDRERA
jgi:outer membrane lipopolysaccharide assembly protein LptE/RlpB